MPVLLRIESIRSELWAESGLTHFLSPKKWEWLVESESELIRFAATLAQHKCESEHTNFIRCGPSQDRALKGNGGVISHGYRTSPHFPRSPCNHPSTPMIQRVRPPLRVFPATRRVDTFPIRHHTFRWRLASISPTHPISISSASMRRARSRAADSYRRPSMIIREVERKPGLSVGNIVGYTSLVVIGEVAQPFLSPYLTMTNSVPRLCSV